MGTQFIQQFLLSCRIFRNNLHKLKLLANGQVYTIKISWPKGLLPDFSVAENRPHQSIFQITGLKLSPWLWHLGVLFMLSSKLYGLKKVFHIIISLLHPGIESRMLSLIGVQINVNWLLYNCLPDLKQNKNNTHSGKSQDDGTELPLLLSKIKLI